MTQILRMSNLYAPTLKEDPSDADIDSARLLLRVLQFGVSADGLIQRLKLAVLAHQRPPFFLILHHRRVGEQHAQLLHARVHPIEFFQHAPSFLAPTTRQFCP